jgi:hypothetical protein
MITKTIFFFSHYISTPQLAFDCMLRSTGIELELLTDIEKILFVEQNVRGGMAYIAQRYSEAGPQINTSETVKFFIELLKIDGKKINKKNYDYYF